jgi:exosome complex component RRP42
MSSRHGIVSRLKRKKIKEVIAAGKRMDGRGLEDYREIAVKMGVLEKAEGSAEVHLGDTRVLVGVKVGIGTPFEDTPTRGSSCATLSSPPSRLPPSSQGLQTSDP